MARHSPLNIEGTALSYRDPDGKGRPTVAQVRAKDEQGRWQAKRFPVTSWTREGEPKLPEDALTWARATRRTFVREEAVAVASTFQEFAEVLIAGLSASGVSEERTAYIAAVSKGLAGAGITDMRRDTFAPRVQGWIRDLDVGWSLPADATNRRKKAAPLSPRTRNMLLIICRQVTGLAVRKRRLPFDPLAEIPKFKEESKLKPLFSIDELARMVSDESRDHHARERAELESAIAAIGGERRHAIAAVAKERDCHWSSIYGALRRDPVPDPWWLACCILVFSGCRAQEAMHLRWEWVRWDERLITLKIADDFEIKTDQERLIPLEPELRDILHPLAKPSGHILPPEIRAGGSGMRRHKTSSQTGKGAADYTNAMRVYLRRIGMDPGDRTVHSLRHCFISMKLARADMNVERLRKAVGHATFDTTMGYAKQSQHYEAQVDRWPDSSLWLRREVPAVAKATVAK